jgi:hypothetical protein
VAEGLITPDQLRSIAEEKDMEKAREALEKKRKTDDEHQQLHDAFMSREIHPDVFERVSKVVRSAAERGEREVLVVRFSSQYCTDGGRALNNFEPEWPDTLAGFAKRAYEFWQKELEPARLQAARPDHGFPRRRAGRRRHVPPVVNLGGPVTWSRLARGILHDEHPQGPGDCQVIRDNTAKAGLPQ